MATPRAEGGRRLTGQRTKGSVEHPLVSVVTVVFNGAVHVEQAIDAVARQTYPSVEHIVIDGGSTDGTVDIIRRHEGYLGYWVSERDGGIYDAMNKAVAMIDDPDSYVIFANADDHLFSDEAIERAMSLADGEDLVYGRMVLSDDTASAVVGKRVELGDLAVQTLCHPATFVRKRVFDRVGLFDPGFRIAADYDHVVRCFAAPVTTRYVDVIVSRMRMGGMSEDQFMTSCRERKAVIRRHFPLVLRTRGILHVNFYDIPRNAARRWIGRAGLLGYWRALKGS